MLQNLPKSFNHFSVSAVNDIQIAHSVFGFGILAFKFPSLQYKRARQNKFCKFPWFIIQRLKKTLWLWFFSSWFCFVLFWSRFVLFGSHFVLFFCFCPKLGLCWFAGCQVAWFVCRGRGGRVSAELCFTALCYITFGYIALNSWQYYVQCYILPHYI